MVRTTPSPSLTVPLYSRHFFSDILPISSVRDSLVVAVTRVVLHKQFFSQEESRTHKAFFHNFYFKYFIMRNLRGKDTNYF